MMIVPPDVMSPEDIQLLRDNGICVVVATDPAKLRFMDPIPAASNRTEIENAAIALSRKLLNGFGSGSIWNKGDFARIFIDLLAKGTPIDPNGTFEEQERRIFDDAKADEIRRIAREEARAERAARNAKKAK